MIAFGIVAGLTVLALIAAGTVVWTIQRSFPQLSGTVAVAGLEAEVTVHRDVLGVPTIVAGSAHDLFFAQGYVHAQDRFWEMDFRRHVTSGRLSELFGASQLGTDQFLRTLGWRRIAEQEVAALDETSRTYYDAYADGVNAYLADHEGAAASFEYAVLDLQNPGYAPAPWTPADSVAWLKAMAWDLRENIDVEIDRATSAAAMPPEEIAQLYPGYPYDLNPVIVPTIPSPGDAGATTTGADSGIERTGPEAGAARIAWREVGSVVEAASALLGRPGEGVGSNSWVVSGAHTRSGLPLLANDPHLSASLPGIWHQAGLRCRTVSEACPFEVAGFGFAGVPGVAIGHNADIAWGMTNLTSDVTDLYIERIEGDRYWRDGELVPLETRIETFRVAGREDVELEVRSTVHGPILSDFSGFDAIADDPRIGSTDAVTLPGDPPSGEYAVSLRWTALDPGTTARAIFAVNRAQDFTQFRAAARLFEVPAQNLIYADRMGNIGYQTPGRLPIRGAGDGSMPQPGWDSAYDWQGFIPADELPIAYNPESGYIVTANNAVVGEDYPYILTGDWDYGWRAARITELLDRATASGGLTVADMSRIQADQEFWMGRRLVTAYASLSVDDAGTRGALDLLGHWDAQNDPDSPAAAYANVLWDELAQNLFTRRDDPVPLSNQGRLFLVVDGLLDDADSPWWTSARMGVDGRDEMLRHTAVDAYERLVALQGENPNGWNWGGLHALTLRHGTFGSSGVAPLEALFNRGPYPVGGGTAVVDATGWYLGTDDFATYTVPSMRMTVDLADLDASRWNNLTGVSGHAFHPNYTDQVDAWQQRRQTPWPFSLEAVRAAATDTLRLTPADRAAASAGLPGSRAVQPPAAGGVRVWSASSSTSRERSSIVPLR